MHSLDGSPHGNSGGSSLTISTDSLGGPKMGGTSMGGITPRTVLLNHVQQLCQKQKGTLLEPDQRNWKADILQDVQNLQLATAAAAHTPRVVVSSPSIKGATSLKDAAAGAGFDTSLKFEDGLPPWAGQRFPN
jgi:hypothetical protein